jgi:hypothetical protein
MAKPPAKAINYRMRFNTNLAYGSMVPKKSAIPIKLEQAEEPAAKSRLNSQCKKPDLESSEEQRAEGVIQVVCKVIFRPFW